MTGFPAATNAFGAIPCRKIGMAGLIMTFLLVLVLLLLLFPW
jgi:hypothetical protein